MASRRTPGAPPAKRRPGRPTYWTVPRKKAAFKAICALVSEGSTFTRALVKLGLQHPDRKYPTFTQMYEWMVAGQPAARELTETFTQAKEVRAQVWSEQLSDIAEFGQNDSYLDAKGNTRTDWDVLGRSKLRIETTEKLLARHDPKRFGAKLDLTTGGEKLPPAALLPAYVPIGTPPDHHDAAPPPTPPAAS